MSKYKLTQLRQFEILVDFMQAHPELSKEQLKVITPKSECDKLWKILASELNAAGPPTREIVGWKKVWTDYKKNYRTRMRRSKASISETDGDQTKYPLIPLEEEASRLLFLEDEISSTGEFVPVQCSSAQLSPELMENNSSNDCPSETTSVKTEFQPKENGAFRSRVRIASHSKDGLLQEEVDNKINYHQHSLKLLENITENLRGISKCMKKTYELEEKRYKLAKEKFEHKKRRDIEKSRQKLAELKLKKHMILTLGL